MINSSARNRKKRSTRVDYPNVNTINESDMIDMKVNTSRRGKVEKLSHGRQEESEIVLRNVRPAPKGTRRATTSRKAYQRVSGLVLVHPL